MRTLYIDVYFLINLTADILAMYFAAVFASVPTTVKRIVSASAVGAAAACGIALIGDFVALKLGLTFVSLLIMALIGTKRISVSRRVRFVFSFIIFEALVGGIVTFLWDLLDKHLYGTIESAAGGGVNRKMLIFALIVLLSIGVFKMLVSFFSKTKCAGSVEIEICFFGKTVRTEAFVDSGNLAIDPMDMRPVLFLKLGLAERILPQNVIRLTDPDAIDREVRRRVRLIPVSRGGTTHVLTGVRADYVRVLTEKERYEEIGVTLAIDREEGSFGGYDALMPAAVLENVV